MQLGCSTWGMPRLPVDEALAGIAEIGYTAVELTVIPGYTTALETLDAGERRRIRTLLTHHALDLPAIAGHTSLLADDPEAARAAMARLKATADLAVDLAAGETPPVLNTTTGGPPDRWEELRGRLIDRLGELVAYAAGRGVVVAIEPHVGAALDRPERVLWLLREIDSAYLRVNLDFSHFEAVGLPMAACVASLAPYTVHTHVKDVRGRAPEHEFLIPGEGGFDYPAFLHALQEGGYDGAITVEISVMVQRRREYDPLAAVRQAYGTLAPALAEVTRRASPG
jgi:sugar phosphate isomerase/epimerase